MKKLNAISIDKTKLIPDEELKIIRGGYDYGGYLTCRIGNSICLSILVWNCSDENIRVVCNKNCPGWDNAVCAGE